MAKPSPAKKVKKTGEMDPEPGKLPAVRKQLLPYSTTLLPKAQQYGRQKPQARSRHILDDDEEDEEAEEEEEDDVKEQTARDEATSNESDEDSGVPYEVECPSPPKGPQGIKRKRDKTQESLEPDSKPLEQVSSINPRLNVHYKVNQKVDKNGTLAPAWSSLPHYKAFNTSDMTIRIGDLVYVRHEGEKSRSFDSCWIAQVLETRALDSEHVYVRVFWINRAKDLHCGKQDHHATGELFPTNLMDIIDAMTVDEKLPIDKLAYLDDQNLNDMCGGYSEHFYRQTYDYNQRQVNHRLVPRLNRRCKCRQPVDPDYGAVVCPKQSCAKWLHPKCLEKDAVGRAYSGEGQAEQAGGEDPTSNSKADVKATPETAGKATASGSEGGTITLGESPKKGMVNFVVESVFSTISKSRTSTPAPAFEPRPRTADGTPDVIKSQNPNGTAKMTSPNKLHANANASEPEAAIASPQKKSARSPTPQKTPDAAEIEVEAPKLFIASLERQPDDRLYSEPLLVTVERIGQASSTASSPVKTQAKNKGGRPRKVVRGEQDEAIAEQDEAAGEKIIIEAQCLFCREVLLVPKGHFLLDPALKSAEVGEEEDEEGEESEQGEEGEGDEGEEGEEAEGGDREL